MKKIVAVLSVLFIASSIVIPGASVDDFWWDDFSEIIISDALATLDGFLVTESIEKAIGSGGRVAIFNRAIQNRRDIRSFIAGSAISLGGEKVALYDAFLKIEMPPIRIAENGQADGLSLEWRVAIERDILKYLDLEDDLAYQRYLHTSPWTSEGLLEEIRNRLSNTHEDERGLRVSENFIPNLERAIKLISEGGDLDEPQEALDNAVVYLLNSAFAEIDDDNYDDIIEKAKNYNSTRSNRRKNIIDLGDNDSILDLEHIERTYQNFKSSGINADIVLAWIFVDSFQHSSRYHSELYCWGASERHEQTDNELYCWGSNFSRVIIDEDADSRDNIIKRVANNIDFLDPDDDGDTVLTRDELVLRIGQNSALSNNDQIGLDVAPFIENSRTMLPFRYIGEQLGAEISWVAETREVTYIKRSDDEDIVITLRIGENQAVLNGRTVQVDENRQIVPSIVNGRTVVPVRFISETLGYHVQWDAVSQAVTITNSRPTV